MIRPALFALLTSVSLAVATSSLHAQSTATYSFEAPQFTTNETTPFLNRAPNSGDAAFRTTFSDHANATDATFNIQSGDFGPLTGQYIFEPASTTGLDATFSTSVTILSLDFVVDAPYPGGSLSLLVLGQTFTFAGGDLGGLAGGHLDFTSAQPFNQVEFFATGPGGTATQFAMDNLVLTEAAVPEPSTWATLSLGAVGAGVVALRRRRTA